MTASHSAYRDPDMERALELADAARARRSAEALEVAETRRAMKRSDLRASRVLGPLWTAALVTLALGALGLCTYALTWHVFDLRGPPVLFVVQALFVVSLPAGLVAGVVAFLRKAP